MWTKDLIRELIDAVKALPDEIGEVIARQPASARQPTSSSNRTNGSQKPGELSSLARDLESALGSLGKLIPGLGRIASTIRNLRESVEAINKLGGFGAVSRSAYSGRSTSSSPAGAQPSHPGESSAAHRQRSNDTILKSAAENARTATDGMKARERWVKTVLGAKVQEQAREATGSEGFKSRAAWVKTVLSAKGPEQPRRQETPAGETGQEPSHKQSHSESVLRKAADNAEALNEAARANRRPFAESGKGAYRFPDADEIAKAKKYAQETQKQPIPPVDLTATFLKSFYTGSKLPSGFGESVAKSAREHTRERTETPQLQLPFRPLARPATPSSLPDIANDVLSRPARLALPAPSIGSKTAPTIGKQATPLPEAAKSIESRGGKPPGSIPKGIFSNITPAFLRRYKAYGSLPGAEDRLGKILDKHPLIRDLVLACATNGIARKLLTGPGGGGRGSGSGAGGGGGDSGEGGYYPLVPRGGGALSTLSKSALSVASEVGARRLGGKALSSLAKTALSIPLGDRVRVIGITTNAAGAVASRALVPAGTSALATTALAGGARAGMAALGVAAAPVAIAAAAIAAVAAVGAALVMLPPKLASLADAAVNSQRKLAAVHPGMAGVLAHYDVAGIIRDRRLADRTVRTTGLLAQQAADLQDSLVPQKSFFKHVGDLKDTVLTAVGRSITNITAPVFDAADKGVPWDKIQFSAEWATRAMGAIGKGLIFQNMPAAMAEFGQQLQQGMKKFVNGSYDTTAWSAWMSQISKDAAQLPLKPAGYVP